MAVTRDIPRAWIRPRQVVSELLQGGPSDRVAFVYLAVASVLGFVAQLPALVRRSREIDPELDAAIVAEAQAAGMAVTDVASTKFEALMSGALMGWIFIVPLLMYVAAWLIRGIAHLIGGRGTGLRVRVALFFSFLAVSPALLLLGLTSGFVGPGPAETAIGLVLVCGFIWISLNALYVAETPNA
ncbi:YIP1 family protein [Jannaschia seohaensis]|uniref:Yip1 domain-containing protein n=1 Tax=Jannaschia seohaensis TaxID=475081 RepID=A0A2Y9AAF5_9RHOB|nr:YIP1 family protein [Jannaschia seohaensis]PWJ20850.1 hypothetical protein BCF38_10296 [Jannaschia seohaensis]SSA41260.1 hypothetical protein SAMN05421539_10296 [Jannaschia seohaensis]